MAKSCSVPDCEKPTRCAQLCWMHYHRWYRHGDVNRVASQAPSVSMGRRYRTRYLPTHPLAMKNGNVYEHRLVLFDTIGLGPHACHWCGTEVDWLPKGDPRQLQPDHLNNDGADNRPENLVPACRSCNVTRGLQRRADALRAVGWWSHNDTIAQLADGQRLPRITAV